MQRGFYTIMAAQFFSSLADNALFVAAVELLRTEGAPEWQRAALVPMFALFYVVLAPFVGAFADALPKGKVMFISNAIKVVGCLMMLFGSHPLMAYAVVGLGAAAYSPAKYGILTELLPASQLVKANGWIEGLTIASIILGVLLGGQLVGQHLSVLLLSIDIPLIDTGVDTAAESAIAALILVYMVAAWFNTHIPHTGVEMRPLPRNPVVLLPDFWTCNLRLWRDRLGQISLGTTTLFWGVSGNLRFIVLAWASAALGYSVTKASALVGVVAIGTAAAIVPLTIAAAPLSIFGASAAGALARIACIIFMAAAISVLLRAPSLSVSTIGRYCTTDLKRGSLRNSAAVSLPSMLSSSAPNTTWRPSSHGVSAVQRKNCEPFVPGPAFAIDRQPKPK